MRQTLTAAALTAAMALGSFGSAQAEDWPASGKTIQVIVPAPGGAGTGDSIARVLADQIANRLKASVVVDNRGGANGNVGATIAASSPADGYKLLFSWAGTLAVNPALYKKLSFDPQKSFEPIALVADVPNILVVNNELPAKSLAEFIDYAKKNPEKLHFGSTGSGSSMHLAAELFMAQTSTKLVHVPYNAPAMATTNLIGNDIQLMFQLVPGIAGQVKGGKVRALALMSDARSPALPDVPTMAELGQPTLLSSTWFALLAPKGTPAAILDKLNAVVNESLSDPEVKKKLAAMGAAPLGGTRQQLADHLAKETAKWGKVVREANIQIQ
ncbi:tripartite tricarboxylate transporter substrate binding protein [Xanthobacteraceae bacterium Astr-EGSB]|uniref:Bug family tripartite tricarboxylate transporter substrate binding protein n=1 Tax=Astrobacterium formosum TaxID=3069710 RepID=UPI0027ADE7B8|nr:tripartite tricarboxylate transporter substrate binding protein [Xanthobacteraceae bacterium Astr-EGSB]